MSTRLQRRGKASVYGSQSRGKVSVYSASDSNDVILLVCKDEARKMLNNGEGVMLCRNCSRSDSTHRRFCGPHGQQHNFVLTVTPLFRNHRRSKPTITFREIQANAGVVMEHENGAIRAAQEKVKAWPFEHDNRAVVVIPREAFA